MAAILAASPGHAQADEPAGPIAIEAEYVHDLVAIAQGPATGIRRTDLFSISANLSLEESIGWQGARLYFNAIAGTGQQPNDLAATLQGINNIEVTENRVRLFEAWIEQAIPAINGSLRVGFSDLNAEFYVNDAAGLLLAPSFGIGPELSATGSNGPAIYPSTAATVRLRAQPWRQGYVQVAAINADAGVPGDRQGIRPLFGSGALLIGEVGHAGKAKVAFGGWAYSRARDDIRLTTPAGGPVGSKARGAYVLAEAPLLVDGLRLFARAGISDGDTTPYSGGWQAGLFAEAPFAGRPDGLLSLGVAQGILSAKYRANAEDAGQSVRKAETTVELTYADKLAPWLTIQPDVQYVWNAMRGPDMRNALVLTLRLRAGFTWP